MYQNRAQIMRVLSQHCDDPRRWFNRWRIFFLTCEVFFALNDGDEYFVSHHLLDKSSRLNKLIFYQNLEVVYLD